MENLKKLDQITKLGYKIHFDHESMWYIANKGTVTYMGETIDGIHRDILEQDIEKVYVVECSIGSGADHHEFVQGVFKKEKDAMRERQRVHNKIVAALISRPPVDLGEDGQAYFEWEQIKSDAMQFKSCTVREFEIK